MNGLRMRIKLLSLFSQVFDPSSANALPVGRPALQPVQSKLVQAFRRRCSQALVQVKPMQFAWALPIHRAFRNSASNGRKLQVRQT